MTHENSGPTQLANRKTLILPPGQTHIDLISDSPPLTGSRISFITHRDVRGNAQLIPTILLPGTKYQIMALSKGLTFSMPGHDAVVTEDRGELVLKTATLVRCHTCGQPDAIDQSTKPKIPFIQHFMLSDHNPLGVSECGIWELPVHRLTTNREDITCEKCHQTTAFREGVWGCPHQFKSGRTCGKTPERHNPFEAEYCPIHSEG